MLSAMNAKLATGAMLNFPAD